MDSNLFESLKHAQFFENVDLQDLVGSILELWRTLIYFWVLKHAYTRG